MGRQDTLTADSPRTASGLSWRPWPRSSDKLLQRRIREPCVYLDYFSPLGQEERAMSDDPIQDEQLRTVEGLLSGASGAGTVKIALNADRSAIVRIVHASMDKRSLCGWGA